MKEISSFNFSVPFKGERKYLQSADVYTELLNQLEDQIQISECRNIRLIFRDFAATELEVSSAPPHEIQPNATFSCSVDNRKVKLYISETGTEISDRHPYPEEDIVNCCSIDIGSKSVFLTRTDLTQPFKLIELVVGMNKAMHQEVFSQFPGKWLFTEISSPGAIHIQDPTNIEIRLERNLGVKLTRSKIFFEGAEVGYICFSLQPPSES